MKVLGSVYESEYYVKQCISTEGVKNQSHEFLRSGTKTTIIMYEYHVHLYVSS